MIQRNPNDSLPGIQPVSTGVPGGLASVARSLEGLHGSVPVPHSGAGFWKHYRAFVGPAMLISVGYMDPGNWATDLEAGALFKYGLLWVVGLASAMAVVLQICSARLGVVMGKDLAQACRDYYPAWTRWPNWLACEVAIVACDLAEVLGSALAINLLFGIPLPWAVAITAFDVLLLLSLQGLGMRVIEAVIVVLIATIGVCYFVEIFVLPSTHPSFGELGRSLVSPSLLPGRMTTLAIGIVGATVMPHNLYLHSALVQSRKLQSDDASVRKAIQFNALDSVVALSLAFVINAAILVLAGMVFFGNTSVSMPDGSVVRFDADSDWIQIAHLTLAPLLGTTLASVMFAVALLASGQSSTLTGTLAGQVVMEGFMHWRVRPWLRRLITRMLAIVPAILIVAVRKDVMVTQLVNLTQVVLAIQLPLAMFPLMHFTSCRRYMGRFANGWFLLIAGWSSAILITALDIYGLPGALSEAWNLIVGG